MSDDIIARAEAALEGVSAEPWHIPRRGTGIDSGEYGTVIGGGNVDCMAYCYGGSSTIEGDNLEADLRFIAAARSLLPELVAELETTRAQLEADAAELTAYRRDHYDSHMFGHVQDRSDVRCYGCNLRYGERQEYVCGDDGQPGAPGGAHDYDERELAAAMTCDDPIHQYARQFEEARNV